MTLASVSTNFTMPIQKMRRFWGTKVYLAPDEVRTNEEDDAKIVRLTVKQFATDKIDRKSFMHFSHLNPSHLLLNLCTVLQTMGICHVIADDKMKVTFEIEKTT